MPPEAAVLERYKQMQEMRSGIGTITLTHNREGGGGGVTSRTLKR